MRIIENSAELSIRKLGQVPGFEVLKDQITTSFDLLDRSTLTTEKVFFGTHRLVAANPLAEDIQRYSTADRTTELLDLATPTIEWLKTIYKQHVPILVQCATIPVGAKLLWHIDSYLYQSVSHKVHIPIVTNPNAKYECLRLQKESYYFMASEAYEINNILLHRSVNFGDTPRTHLIIDMIHEDKLFAFVSSGINPIFSYHLQNKATETRLLKAMK